MKDKNSGDEEVPRKPTKKQPSAKAEQGLSESDSTETRWEQLTLEMEQQYAALASQLNMDCNYIMNEAETMARSALLDLDRSIAKFIQTVGKIHLLQQVEQQAESSSSFRKEGRGQQWLFFQAQEQKIENQLQEVSIEVLLAFAKLEAGMTRFVATTMADNNAIATTNTTNSDSPQDSTTRWNSRNSMTEEELYQERTYSFVCFVQHRVDESMAKLNQTASTLPSMTTTESSSKSLHITSQRALDLVLHFGTDLSNQLLSHIENQSCNPYRTYLGTFGTVDDPSSNAHLLWNSSYQDLWGLDNDKDSKRTTTSATSTAARSNENNTDYGRRTAEEISSMDLEEYTNRLSHELDQALEREGLAARLEVDISDLRAELLQSMNVAGYSPQQQPMEPKIVIATEETNTTTDDPLESKETASVTSQSTVLVDSGTSTPNTKATDSKEAATTSLLDNDDSRLSEAMSKANAAAAAAVAERYKKKINEEKQKQPTTSLETEAETFAGEDGIAAIAIIAPSKMVEKENMTALDMKEVKPKEQRKVPAVSAMPTSKAQSKVNDDASVASIPVEDRSDDDIANATEDEEKDEEALLSRSENSTTPSIVGKGPNKQGGKATTATQGSKVTEKTKNEATESPAGRKMEETPRSIWAKLGIPSRRPVKKRPPNNSAMATTTQGPIAGSSNSSLQSSSQVTPEKKKMSPVVYWSSLVKHLDTAPTIVVPAEALVCDKDKKKDKSSSPKDPVAELFQASMNNDEVSSPDNEGEK
jgi:hypothetical protein